MDPEILVGNRIEDGRKLVAELIFAGFDVSVAFWVKTAEEGLWFLYIGSTAVEPAKIGDAYRTLYACLNKIPDASVEMSAVKLVQADNPIATSAMALRDRQTSRFPIRFQGNCLGSLAIEEAYVYPRVGGQMTPQEIVQTVFGIANRPAKSPARPSVITLRNGARVTAIITGFNLQTPSSLTIHTLDPASNAKGQISGDEVINVQP